MPDKKPNQDDQEVVSFPRHKTQLTVLKNVSSAEDIQHQKKIRGKLKWNFSEDNFRHQGY